MPNRILREGILTSTRVNQLPPAAELFYRRLLSVVDDYGRFHAHPAILRTACYPHPQKLGTTSESDVSSWLNLVSHAGLIRLYTVKGISYLEVADFRQRVRSESKYPPPPGDPPDRPPDRHVDGHNDGHDARTPRALGGDGGEDGGGDGGASAGAREPPAFTGSAVAATVGREVDRPLPGVLDHAPFREALQRWLTYLADERGRPPSMATVDSQLKTLANIATEETLEAAIDAIEFAIRAGLRAPVRDTRTKTAGSAGAGKKEGTWALEQRLKRVKDELSDLLYPGGCSHSVYSTLSEKEKVRANELMKTKKELHAALTKGIG